MLVDDFSRPGRRSALGTSWQATSDRVMGGRSQAGLIDLLGGGLGLRGPVRLENNGGFVMASLDLASAGQALDASAFDGLALTYRSGAGLYGLRLRTSDCQAPWQSYRASLPPAPDVQATVVPFSAFEANRIETPFDPQRLERLGVIALGLVLGAPFEADIDLFKLAFV